MKKETIEITATVGSIAVAGACVLTGSCQIGAIALAPITTYYGVETVKEMVEKRKITRKKS